MTKEEAIQAVALAIINKGKAVVAVDSQEEGLHKFAIRYEHGIDYPFILRRDNSNNLAFSRSQILESLVVRLLSYGSILSVE